MYCTKQIDSQRQNEELEPHRYGRRDSRHKVVNRETYISAISLSSSINIFTKCLLLQNNK